MDTSVQTSARQVKNRNFIRLVNFWKGGAGRAARPEIASLRPAPNLASEAHQDGVEEIAKIGIGAEDDNHGGDTGAE
jgi:hypothetical protein